MPEQIEQTEKQTEKQTENQVLDSKKKGKKANKQKKEKKPKQSNVQQLGLTVKKTTETLPDWYQQVITKSELIDYYDISGCYVLRPRSFAVWDYIREYIDAEIKKYEVVNCYFPLFVSRKRLEKEASHLEGFAPEVAWVTMNGTSKLEEPIAIRPTSETIMYPSYAKWIRSHRDLPLKLNQWANVVRWEIKDPTPFLRTREFLWQEGHTAFATKEEADTEVLDILDIYARVYSDLLAIPVIKGRKSEKEKFAGADYTTTVEAYVSTNGRGIQGATSHHLGQNFSKMFGIQFEDDSKEMKYVYQNSWGMSTRTLGVFVMIHGDDKGLVMPPRVAPQQVVICPLLFKNSDYDEAEMMKQAMALNQVLADAGIRSVVDDHMNKKPGWRYNHWELRGIPLRIELGPKDIDKKCVVIVRRDTGKKIFDVAQDTLATSVKELLDTIHNDMYARAEKQHMENIVVCHDWDNFMKVLNQQKQILVPFCGEIACEGEIKEKSFQESQKIKNLAISGAAKSLCRPFNQKLCNAPALNDSSVCFHCRKRARHYYLFGRSY